MKVWVIAAVAAVALLVAAFAVAGNPFGASVSEQVSAEVDSDARCREAGLQVVAGERETVYTCRYRGEFAVTGSNGMRRSKGYMSACFAVIDGRVYPVSVDPC